MNFLKNSKEGGGGNIQSKKKYCNIISFILRIYLTEKLPFGHFWQIKASQVQGCSVILNIK